MAQGKLKVKTKLPAKSKKKTKTVKRGAVTKRNNRPVAPKKQKFEQASKIKKAVTKTVNKAMEAEIRGRATQGKRSLSKAQQAVATHHEKQSAKKKK